MSASEGASEGAGRAGAGAGANAGAELALEARGVVKVYGENRVLDGVDLVVRRGEIVSLIGRSGGGKSTLLKCLIGATRPTAGRIFVLGREVTGASEAEINEVRRTFGVLFQSGALFNSMTVGENLALPLRRHTRLDEPTIQILVRLKLELVGLRGAEDLVPAELSGGMKKRVGLARALALEPRLVFFDEPHAGLDPVSNGMIDKLIVDLTRKLGITSVVVTHELPSALRISDRVVMLDHGRIVADAPPARLSEIGDPLVCQFVTGSAEGPVSFHRSDKDYAEDVLEVAEKYTQRRKFLGRG